MTIARTPQLFYFHVKVSITVYIFNIRLINIENQMHHDKGSYEGHTHSAD